MSYKKSIRSKKSTRMKRKSLKPNYRSSYSLYKNQLMIGEDEPLSHNEIIIKKKLDNKYKNLLKNNKEDPFHGISVQSFVDNLLHKKRIPSKTEIELYQEQMVNDMNEKCPSLKDRHRSLQWMKARGSISYSTDTNNEHWTRLLMMCKQRLLYPPIHTYLYHRYGYNLDWTSLPKKTRDYFISPYIKSLVTSYLTDPVIAVCEIHVNADTELGKKSQYVHRDCSIHGVVTLMIMLHPEHIIGTCFLPASHINSGFIVNQTDHHLCQRVTYTHNSLLFDSFLYHYGPSTKQSVYKLSFVFMNKSLVKNKDILRELNIEKVDPLLKDELKL
jgi:hypothetical protein